MNKAQEKRIVILDILRIFSLLLVIFTHIAQSLKSVLGSFFGVPHFYWVSFGGIAVTVFIFLSGLVLELNYGKKKYSYREFMVKRLTYIYPIYWLSLCLGVIVYLMRHPSEQFLQEFSNPLKIFHFFTGTYAFSADWSGPFLGTSWFIGLIVVLYFIFPILSNLSKKNRNVILFLCLSVSFSTRLILGNYENLFNRPLDWFPLARIFEFYLGIYMAQSIFFIDRLKEYNNKFQFRYLNYFAELSFPAFLVHFELLYFLPTYIQLFGKIVGISLILLFTIIISMVIDASIKILIYKKHLREIIAKS